MKLQSHENHPHGLEDAEYDNLFTKDKPIIFAFHGYHTLIHELTYRRTNRNIHVYGYQEEGTITTPFDMRVQNEIDRFNLVKDAIMHLPQLGNRGSYLIQKGRNQCPSFESGALAHRTCTESPQHRVLAHLWRSRLR